MNVLPDPRLALVRECRRTRAAAHHERRLSRNDDGRYSMAGRARLTKSVQRAKM